ncbi:MAG TPA: chemotaxis protein CheB [Caulobacteraceae bacterium]|jgi:two-component system CheB/CheR fusion protein|nr:chemotaxis protein CheB [Caulobacteraceae bacterium]
MARKATTKKAAERTGSGSPIPVVGIGASAGGVHALQTFFESLPPESGAAYVVIVHLDPNSHSELPEILASRAQMPVTQVTGRAELKKDCIYVIPPDRQLRLSDHEISAERFAQPRGHRAPIDHFFRSLADQHGDGFAVILTGAGSDGALGVKGVKEAGGIVLVQDPEEAEYASMPSSAIATGVADFVLPMKELTSQLVELIKAKAQVIPAEEAGVQEETLRRILAQVRVRTGHDFMHYKRSTVLRRIIRRMQVSRQETLEDYVRILRENAEEAEALLGDLLVSVTTFFRDPEAFDALAKRVIPELFKSKTRNDPIRVWVAGCATGEEAFSVAILLLEEAARHEVRPEIQVFGSDMDVRALAIAREGRYPAAIENDVNEERLRRFFARDAEYYRVKRELRDIVLFANHSVLKDPPFSKLDLISCRNLLIYLDRELQQQVLSTLHYGLVPNGYLFLGSSETADTRDNLFHVVDRDTRIFQSTGRSPNHLPALPRLAGMTGGQPVVSQPAAHLITASGALTAHRKSLEDSAPPSILIDSAYRVLHLSETAGRYLQPPGGPLAAGITELVRPELRFELQGALNRAFSQGETVLTPALYVRFNGHPVRVLLQVKPARTGEGDDEHRQALVLFLEGDGEEPVGSHAGSAASSATSQTVERLEQELEIAQARVRTTREESESATEELRAANEELLSINEEYRSTAEELETSKEELQSINEELQTVNSELKLKLETVSRGNSDLQNLMAAMDFGTLFLDPGLRIKRFTPRLVDLFSITPSDIGRPITDFAHQLDYDDLAADARKVLTDLSAIEKEIRSRKGRWYLARVRPYRTVEDKIDGVVATFVDITERREMEDALRASADRLRQESRLVELSRAPILVWDFNDGIVQWNRGSEALYGYSKVEALGRNKEELLQTTVAGSSFDAVKKALQRHGAWKGELHQITKNGQRLTTDAHIELITTDRGRFVMESMRDVTEAKASEARQRLLLNELTHRVKNILTVVQGVIHQTWRAGGRDDFLDRVDGRISALAASHELLVESDWRGADLESLVKGQLSLFIGERPERLKLSGDSVMLPADVATPFGLVLHELATNAAKYGALSNDSGDVSLSWATKRGNRDAMLTVIWQELGGPPVSAGHSAGFGSRLIQSGLPGATVKHEFLPEGVRCQIDVPLRPAGDSETAA